MKSLNNLLLLGDGETWSRQKIDFSGLPEMVRTFLQVAAGAADIPVTRLLGQSPAGMSATGESDTRNYYDMISSRQEIDLRPKLERLDALLLRSAGVDPSALTFEFRPLWQMDAAASAAIALQKAQASQIYAGLNLWPASVTAQLVQSQLVEDGTYPGAEGIFAEAPLNGARPTTDFDPAQPRDPEGRWTNGGESSSIDPAAFHIERERRRERKRRKRQERERAHREGLSTERSEPFEGAAHAKRREFNPQSEAAASKPEASALPLQAPAPASPPSVEPFSPPPAVFKPDGIPNHWIEKPTRKNGGMQWTDPTNENNTVRSMPGNPDSPYPHQKVPYIVDQNGGFRDIDGNLIGGTNPRASPEAHIPASEFIFKRP